MIRLIQYNLPSRPRTWRERLRCAWHGHKPDFKHPTKNCTVCGVQWPLP